MTGDWSQDGGEWTKNPKTGEWSTETERLSAKAKAARAAKSGCPWKKDPKTGHWI